MCEEVLTFGGNIEIEKLKLNLAAIKDVDTENV